MSDLRIACVLGTRPELIKMAPVIRAIRKRAVNVQCIHSGQHSDLATTAFKDMGLHADLCLLTRRTDSSVGSLFNSLHGNLHSLFAQDKPAAVLVHGDTSTAWAACMAAFYQGIPVGHVEAGLRCPTLAEPFPEESHRRLIGRLARWHFAPTQQAAAQLRSENTQGDIVVCGNTAIDSILTLTRSWAQADHTPCPQLLSAWQQKQTGGLRPFRLLVTLHRRENRGQTLINFVRELGQWLSQSDSHSVIWPLHANPELQAEIRHAAVEHIAAPLRPRIILTPALCYADTIWALAHCDAIATDSGGLQEEASAFFKPVLILRNSTERPEAIQAGYAHLTGCGQGRLPAAINSIQQGLWPRKPAEHSPQRWPFGDGNAAERIASHLLRSLSNINTAASS